MPITVDDLKDYKSTNPDSDGGEIDLTREIATNVLNNLFPSISGSQAAAGGTDYRKAFRRNEHATLTWQAVRSWIAQQPVGATVSVGLGIDDAADDDPLQGNMTSFSATAVVAAVSDGADTRQLTIIGEDAAGARQVVTLTLNGTTEVATTETWSRIYAVIVNAVSGTRTVTIRQGTGGTTRGAIGPNKKLCWLWRTGTDLDSKEEGYQHGDIAPNEAFGLWFRRTWASGAAAVSQTSIVVRSEGDTDA